ncbi:MAG: hypothetical protein JXQ90_21500 [Cyclobacteriaceae bacterium]
MNKSTNNFCTIVSQGYISYAKVLLESIQNNGSQAHLHVLVVDAKVNMDESQISFYSFGDLRSFSKAKLIEDKYHNQPGELRWSLKPVFMSYLLLGGIDDLVYLDADMFFFGDYQFIFEELGRSNVLLTPHWRPPDPRVNSKDFHLLLTEGIYNAGFVGVNSQAIEMLKWWEEVCLYDCRKEPSIGLFYDQKYLDLVPIYFEKVKTLKHLGLNVANWNLRVAQRKKEKNEVKINGEFPVIFIHFTKRTIDQIDLGKDKTLRPFLKEYRSSCKKHGITIHKKNRLW